ncbi:hypothetical protein LTS18_003733, partial [Coniosporium uncinatum]
PSKLFPPICRTHSSPSTITMTSYDSDDSLSDADYTATDVLLGYASEEPTSDTFSRLGGHPTWLADTIPSAALAKCKVCNDLMSLLLQLNGDLPKELPAHERRLYVWSCRRKTCRRKEGSVRGFRGTRILKSSASKEKVTEKKEDKPQQNVGAALFGVAPAPQSPNANPFAASNPFSSSTLGVQSNNPFASPSPDSLSKSSIQKPDQDPAAALSETFAQKARIAETNVPSPTLPPIPQKPWPEASELPRPYTTYHLDADYETLDLPSSTIPSNALLDNSAEEAGASSAGGGGDAQEDKALFESSMDKTFQKFADRMAQNPEQVLRYEYGGQPLLYSDTDAVGRRLGSHAAGGADAKVKTSSAGGNGIPSCRNCGAKRVFELQLTPHAIEMLEEGEPDGGIEGMEWGTVLLGVCSQDCGERGKGEGKVGYVEEWVGVQWEEQVMRKG